MPREPSDDSYSKKETKKRRDEALKRALNTPPQPRQPPHYLVVGDKLRVAGQLRRNDDGSITADVYRNLDDYRAGRMMEPAVTFDV